MPWCPFASNHNIPPGPNDPPISPRIIVIHTMVGTMAGSEARFRSTGIEAHFGVAMDGRIWQWRDTAIQADAQGAGNGYCISIETEDGGDPNRRWTEVQFNKLVQLIRWLMETHNIPGTLVRSTSDRGIGYHRQFSEWNPNNHSCPGDVRLAQLRKELLPALQGDELTDAQMAELKTHISNSMREGVRYIDHGDPTVVGSANNLKVVRADIDSTKAAIGQVIIDMTALMAKVDELVARGGSSGSGASPGDIAEELSRRLAT